jgi:hypothetical protein
LSLATLRKVPHHTNRLVAPYSTPFVVGEDRSPEPRKEWRTQSRKKKDIAKYIFSLLFIADSIKGVNENSSDIF